MIQYTVTVRGPLGGARRPDVVDREIQTTLAEIGSIGVRRVVSRTPRGTSFGRGGLGGSVFTEARGVPMNRSQAIASSAFYAPIVEVGRAPGKRPPIAPILTWVTRKLGKTGREAQQVAFLVARKIGRVGYTGAYMFRQSRDEIAPLARQRFEAMAARIARESGGA